MNNSQDSFIQDAKCILEKITNIPEGSQPIIEKDLNNLIQKYKLTKRGKANLSIRNPRDQLFEILVIYHNSQGAEGREYGKNEYPDLIEQMKKYVLYQVSNI